MYIPEFWVGVICTILCEVAAVCGLCAWANWRDKHEDNFHKSNKSSIR